MNQKKTPKKNKGFLGLFVVVMVVLFSSVAFKAIIFGSSVQAKEFEQVDSELKRAGIVRDANGHLVY